MPGHEYNIVHNRVALRKESVDRNAEDWLNAGTLSRSLSARRAWIEIAAVRLAVLAYYQVALRKESVDRNCKTAKNGITKAVALRKESVDRNT